MLVADRYRLGPPLGRGGMGEVYRAEDELLGRAVAVKFLLPTRHDDLAAARFRREARAAALLNDEHVVAAFDFGEHDDGYFLVMELVEGRSVAEELRAQGPLDGGTAVGIVRQAAAGLAAAHRHHIVHRDIKPGNLLLDARGTVKVADFGIARFVADTTTTLTVTGQVVGTSHYLAPERALGRPAEPASDIYALGCVLYQLVTGHPPFQAEEPASIMYQHVETAPVPPSELRPELAGPCETLLFRMLAKDPEDRPTAAEVASGAALVPLDALHTDETPTVPAALLSSRRQLLAAVAAVAAGTAAVAFAVLTGPDFDKFPSTDLIRPTTSTTPPPTVRTSRPPSPVGTTNRPDPPVSEVRTVAPPTNQATKGAPGKEHSKKPKDKPEKPHKP
jgi:serine/threonine-protein kinase